MKEKEILIFSGTSEGRNLAEILLRKGIAVTVCVATEYGQEMMEQTDNQRLTLQAGRMDVSEMERLVKEKEWLAIVDATHPFAEEVTQNIAAACENQGREVMRLLREPADDIGQDQKILFVDSVEEAALYLNQTTGNILLTTGSKSLPEYVEKIQDISRIYVRILPSGQEVEKCRSLGLKGRQIICMQGPFSERMNAATMEEINASVLVTKETAAAGGYPEKLAAARQAGAETVVIRRPKEQGLPLNEILREIGLEPEGENIQKISLEPEENIQRISLKPEEETADISKYQIAIAGIGMGNILNMTGEVQQACQEADLLIGAGRMLDTVRELGKPSAKLYLGTEIARYILEHPQYHKIAVLLSGDVGFYSGAKKLLQALKEAGLAEEPNVTLFEQSPKGAQALEEAGLAEERPEEGVFGERSVLSGEIGAQKAENSQRHRYQIRLLCGISSVQYFASKLQIPWEDITLMSDHGRRQNIVGMLHTHEKVFTLTDGDKGVRRLSGELLRYGLGSVKMYVGCQLSYPDEEITAGMPEQFLDYEKEGIMAVLLIHKEAKETPVTHGISDELFVRGKVPMTKEEVRSVSLSKLALCRDSVVYDIGAGTGSIAAECARIAAEGKVYAIEKNPKALELIEKNKHYHRAWNLDTIAGEAPEALEGLEAPTHAFIGGSSGKLERILEVLWQKSPGVRIVLNVISLETLQEAVKALKKYDIEQQEIVQVTVAKARQLGSHHLMMGQNPVYIITLQKSGGRL